MSSSEASLVQQLLLAAAKRLPEDVPARSSLSRLAAGTNPDFSSEKKYTPYVRRDGAVARLDKARMPKTSLSSTSEPLSSTKKDQKELRLAALLPIMILITVS